MELKSISLAIAIGVLSGCAARQPPQISTEPGVSLAGYKEIAIAPVSNETGQTFDFDFVSAFTDDLKLALRAKGYDVTDPKASSPNTLIVQCSFAKYEPGNRAERAATDVAALAAVALLPSPGLLLPRAGAAEATVNTTLIDKKTGEALGDMVVTKAVGSGLFGGSDAYSSILVSAANDIADAIDNKITAPSAK